MGWVWFNAAFRATYEKKVCLARPESTAGCGQAASPEGPTGVTQFLSDFDQ